MNYLFIININTDGDFCLPFIPRGMKYDGDYEYTFKKSYKDRDKAIDDIKDICLFLKEKMSTNREYVKDIWDSHIDRFTNRLEVSSESLSELVEEYMGGNYEGTEFIFRAEAQWLDCSFQVTDEEYELIKKNDIQVTNSMIKEAVLALFKEHS